LTGAFTAERQVCKVDKGGPLIVIYVESIEATREKALAAGGREIVPKFEFPGGYRAHFEDPNGNEFSVWSEA
jgi:predicted enzyme related to lactoylglutathione lyase